MNYKLILSIFIFTWNGFVFGMESNNTFIPKKQGEELSNTDSFDDEFFRQEKEFIRMQKKLHRSKKECDFLINNLKNKKRTVFEDPAYAGTLPNGSDYQEEETARILNHLRRHNS